MGRVLAIDYGLKRTGLAISDELKISANGLETISTNLLFEFLKKNIGQLNISEIIIGLPKDLQNRDTDVTENVRQVTKKIQQIFPTVLTKNIDERFTSKIAQQTLFLMGIPKKKRQEKKRIDQMSALILLQNFMNA